MTAELTAGASFDSDWHVYIDTPDRGPLGYCLGQDDEFDPEAVTLHLAAEGWRGPVNGPSPRMTSRTASTSPPSPRRGPLRQERPHDVAHAVASTRRRSAPRRDRRLRSVGRALCDRRRLPGFTNGARFIDNTIVAAIYGLFSTGFAAVPLLAWRRSDGSHADPGLLRSAWLPWLFTTAQGVAYSSDQGGGGLIALALGWSGFIAAGVTAMYFLGHALRPTTSNPPAPRPGETR